MKECQAVGSQIRAARIKLGLTQADLAARAGIGPDQVSNIERGQSSMKLYTFMRITEALQVSADSLLRLNTPAGRGVVQDEFSSVLADCTPEEIATLLTIVREVKSSLRSNRKAE